MVMKRSPGETIFDVFNVLLMVLIMVATAYPLLYVLFASFSTPEAIYQSKGLLLFPVKPTLGGYQLVFKNPSILSGYKNTFIVLFAGTAINLLLTTLGAYALSRKGLKWGKPLLLLIVFTMYFSGGLIPLFLIVRKLGMISTYWALLLPNAINTWNLLVMRTSFMGIPDSIEESAKMDGAQDFTILFRIILPLSLPIIAVMTLFYGVAQWNSWFYAAIFLRDRAMYPLQLILREILLMNVERESVKLRMTGDMQAMEMMVLIKYAVIIVATVPILFVYPFLQRYFVKGVMVGSIKG
jgi:putative aldouronate transport system permease protein